MNTTLSAEELLIANQSVREKGFWLEQLKACDEKTVIDYDLPGTGDAITCLHEWKMQEETARVLLTMSKERNEALQVVLLALTTVFFQKYTFGKTIVLGTPVLIEPGVAAVGMKVLPLILKVDNDKGFKEAVIKCRQVILEANANRHYPLQSILEYQYQQEANGHTSLFDIGMALENIQDESQLREAGTNLDFLFNSSGDLINCRIQYNAARYQETTIQQLAELFTEITSDLIEDINKPLRLISLVGLHKRQDVMQLLGSVKIDFPVGHSIPDLFRKQAEQMANRTAITCGNDHITYSELDRRSDKLARMLSKYQLQPGSVVMLILERSLNAVVSMLSVLKAGCSYLHVEAGTPIERIRYMLHDSHTALILAQEQFLADLPDSLMDVYPIELIERIDSWSEDLTDLPTVSSDNIAYVIYTSGSTGKPKGVMIEHKSCVNLVYAMNEGILGKYGDGQIMALVSPFIFDACVQLVFGALLFGHQLRILTNKERSDGKLLQESYNRYQVTVSDGTPSHINLLIQAWSKNTFQQDLKLFISGGEALHASRVREWFRLHGNESKPALTNVYGPTECSVNATYYELTVDADLLPALVPIGKPLANYGIYILDENEGLCAIGQPGQLCIAGDGLMRGYLNNPSMTREKMKYIPAAGEKVYLTGDRVKLMPDGNIVFIGRMDNQVKVRGHRIELTEIETYINKHNEVVQSVVVVKHDQGDNAFLAAYYESSSLEPEQLRNYLSQKVPIYMLPACFTRMDGFAYLPNKKINRSALPEPSFPEVRRENDLPVNETEAKLLILWQESLLLPGSAIGVNDNFFNIGGDSIKTISLLYDINEAFGMSFSIVDLYKFDTIRKFAQAIRTEAPVNVQNDELQQAEDEIDRIKNEFMDHLS